MPKLTIDDQWSLVFLLDALLQHDLGNLPEMNSGNWSRRNVEALWRDLKAGPLPDLRRS
jgi:hypothetical protein